ncbi:MAG: FkbM family methyltransferase [Steroidobacteraceae bacterium]
MPFRHVLKALLHRAGVDVVRFTPGSSEGARVAAMMRAHRVDVVFDIGANSGQYGRTLRVGGYEGRIVSFEPSTAARCELVKTAKRDRKWDIAEQMALGSEDNRLELHISGNSVSSSLLPMAELHLSAAPASAYVGSETVPVRRLDDIAKEYLRPESIPFMKIDTQGYEAKVLRGASATLDRMAGVQLELSLVPLYVGQSTYEELTEQLKQRGFALWGLSPAFVDPRTGRLLQVDAAFFRD